VDLGLGELLAGGGALATSVAWIEKRFRDTRRETEIAVKASHDKLVGDLNLSTAEHKNAAARLERQTAQLNRDITKTQLDHAHSLREFPTKADVTDLEKSMGARFDTIEQRIDRAIRGGKS
jgi:hypothetical protein